MRVRDWIEPLWRRRVPATGHARAAAPTRNRPDREETARREPEVRPETPSPETARPETASPETVRREPEGRPEIARWQQALGDFGYPYELIDAASADAVLASERTAGAQAGFVPVIVVPGHWNSKTIAPGDRVLRARELLQEGCDAAHGRQWLLAGLRTMHDDVAIDPENFDPDEFDRIEALPTEDGGPAAGLSIVSGWDQVAIVRVPAASAEELPAYLDWGGWNAVPKPHQIVAVARYWREAYGAELLAMGPDLLEFAVARQPQDHAAAASLLREHYIFCGDSLELIPREDCEDRRRYLAEAAAGLRASNHWAFWWD